jgi:hypothetical protein
MLLVKEFAPVNEFLFNFLKISENIDESLNIMTTIKEFKEFNKIPVIFTVKGPFRNVSLIVRVLFIHDEVI